MNCRLTVRSGAKLKMSPGNWLRLVKHGKPDLLAQINEGRTAESKDREQAIDHQVIVKELVLGERGQLPGHG